MSFQNFYEIQLNENLILNNIEHFRRNVQRNRDISFFAKWASDIYPQ